MEEMQFMFRGASSFNSDISSWNVSSVTDINRMLSGATTSFNQNLCAWGSRLKGTSVSSVFYKTDCPSTSDPDLDLTPPGPFCYACGDFNCSSTDIVSTKQLALHCLKSDLTRCDLNITVTYFAGTILLQVGVNSVG